MTHARLRCRQCRKVTHAHEHGLGSGGDTALKKHGGEAHSTSVPALLLHLYLTLSAKMEDSIAKLKHFSKQDFQSKREVINNGRPMPELKGMLQMTGQKITRSTSHI